MESDYWLNEKPTFHIWCVELDHGCSSSAPPLSPPEPLWHYMWCSQSLADWSESSVFLDFLTMETEGWLPIGWTTVSPPIICQLIVSDVTLLLHPHPLLVLPYTLSLLQCGSLIYVHTAQKIPQNFIIYQSLVLARCASLNQSRPSIRSDSHSLHPKAAANQMVSLNHPPRQGEVCLRASQGQCPFQHLLHTRDTAVAADKRNTQDVFSKALYVSWMYCPILTYTKVLNHYTRIMSLQTPESPRIFTIQIVLIFLLSWWIQILDLFG